MSTSRKAEENSVHASKEDYIPSKGNENAVEWLALEDRLVTETRHKSHTYLGRPPRQGRMCIGRLYRRKASWWLPGLRATGRGMGFSLGEVKML